ncbi:MAG TPA: MarP family serine protease [Candidatus Sulfotelmatobacter sp.]|nr:MarP family serine protease [Candidatus Sulfotelmatobacter sp.]
MLVDIIIIAVIVISLVRNRKGGFLHQFWTLAGFIIGLIAGRWLVNYTLTLAHTSSSRALITIITIFGMAILGLSIGEMVGVKLKHRLLKDRGLNQLDNFLGCILIVVSVLFSAWLIAAIVNDLPSSQLKTDVNKSKIISAMDNLLPAAPSVLSELSHVIDPNGFPAVFVGSEPIPKGNVTLPNLGSFATVVNTDKPSVVRIQGLGCGGIVSGSGFVVGKDLVATNAHVVAGIKNPVVEDSNGHHAAQVIWFDPNLDFAVLKTNDLAGGPLTIDTAIAKDSTPGVVMGYPGGGPFNATAAAVIEEIEASGRNIYGSGLTIRSVYEIQATVIPGNSGGPLIESNGDVIGVVFAESTTYNHVGYALATAKVQSEINQAKASSQTAVSTGQCAE